MSEVHRLRLVGYVFVHITGVKVCQIWINRSVIVIISISFDIFILKSLGICKKVLDPYTNLKIWYTSLVQFVARQSLFVMCCLNFIFLALKITKWVSFTLSACLFVDSHVVIFLTSLFMVSASCRLKNNFVSGKR